MNPSEKEKDEGEIDSTAESKPKSAPTDQETETPPTQSGEASSSQPPTQSGQATSSQPFSQIPSLSTVQRISATIGEGPVPEFFMMQIQNLPKSPSRKSNLGPSPKKLKLTHPDPNPGPNPNPEPGPNPDPYFEVLVSNSDRLPIAYRPAVNFFPAKSPSLTEQILLLTDPLGHLWPNIAYICFDEEEAFILTRNWAQYAEAFNLRVMDTVRFRRGVVLNHFMLQHFPRPKSEPVQLLLPMFLPQNFLFQVELGVSDVEFGRLVIVAEQVSLHCPGIKGGLKPEMVKLTDFRAKNWYVMMVYSAFVDRYMVMDGWPGFVREYELGAGDLVRFYKPNCLSHEKHFLIQSERRGGPMHAQN